MRKPIQLILLASLFAAPVAANPAYLIQAGQVLDRSGEEPRGPTTILVSGGRVVALADGHVGADAFADAPADVAIVDLKDRYVLPGLIDSHVHLRSDEGGVEAQLDAVTESVADVAYEAAVNARKTLMAGFTTVRNFGDGDRVVLALRDAVAAGKVPGPRILDAGRSLSASAGHTDPRLGYLECLEQNPNAYSPEVKAKIDGRIGITGKALERAHKAGVKIAFGTDAGVSKHGRNADEFELMVRFGMTPAESAGRRHRPRRRPDRSR